VLLHSCRFFHTRRGTRLVVKTEIFASSADSFGLRVGRDSQTTLKSGTKIGNPSAGKGFKIGATMRILENPDHRLPFKQQNSRIFTQQADYQTKSASMILPTKNNWAIISLIINELGQFWQKTFSVLLHREAGRFTFAPSLRKGVF